MPEGYLVACEHGRFAVLYHMQRLDHHESGEIVGVAPDETPDHSPVARYTDVCVADGSGKKNFGKRRAVWSPTSAMSAGMLRLEGSLWLDATLQ